MAAAFFSAPADSTRLAKHNTRTPRDHPGRIAAMGPVAPVGPRLLLLPGLLLVLLLFLQLAALPAAGKPIALASPDQVLENMRQIPQWHCLRYRKFDLVTQHKRCRHFRADRKH